MPIFKEIILAMYFYNLLFQGKHVKEFFTCSLVKYVICLHLVCGYGSIWCFIFTHMQVYYWFCTADLSFMSQGVNQGLKSTPVIGTALLNLSEYVNMTQQKNLGFTIPLIIHGCDSEFGPSLNVSAFQLWLWHELIFYICSLSTQIFISYFSCLM